MWKKLMDLVANCTGNKKGKSFPDYEYRKTNWEQLTLALEFESRKQEK